MADFIQTYLLLKHKSDNLGIFFIQVEALSKPVLTVQSVLLRQTFATFNTLIITETCVKIKVFILCNEPAGLFFHFRSEMGTSEGAIQNLWISFAVRSSASLLFHKHADYSESTAELCCATRALQFYSCTVKELLCILQLISKFIIKAGRYCVDHTYQNTITLGVFAENAVIRKHSHGGV